MGTVVLKVPKKKQKVQLIQSEKILNDIFRARQEKIKQKFGFYDLEKQAEIEKQKIEEKIQKEKEFQELIASFEEEKIDAFDFLEKIKEYEIQKNDEFISVENLLENDKISDELETSIDVLNDNFIEKILQNEPEIEIGLPPERIVIPEKTIYTEIFSITEDETPTPIIHSAERNTIDTELAEKYVQNAYERGYEDCQEIANLNATTKINEAHKNVRRIDNLMSELRKHYANKLLKFNEVLIELSCAIAETIIENEVQRDENIVIRQITKAINELNDDTVFSITVHPDDLKILEETKTEIFKNSKSFAGTVFTVAENIERGGCILRTSSGNIDATLKTQLQKIKNEISALADAKKTSKIPFINENIPDAESVSEKFLQQEEQMKSTENETVEEDTVDETVDNSTVEDITVDEDEIAFGDDGIVSKDIE
ncbi:MAG: flagellar assembly protein FliH [Firmicutes bacterium]|nr:flagellar assembly protein FliH [Bacillota bacterium]